MNTGKLIGGIILLLVAIYIFMTQTDFNIQYFGAGIVALIGLVILYSGYKG